MTERTHQFLSKRYVPKWLKLILIPSLSLDEADLVITENENRPCSSILASKKGYEIENTYIVLPYRCVRAILL